MSGRDVNRGSSQAEVGHWWLKIPWALQPGHQGTRPGAFPGTWAQEAHSCFPLCPVREEGFPFSGSVKNAAPATPPAARVTNIYHWYIQ